MWIINDDGSLTLAPVPKPAKELPAGLSPAAIAAFEVVLGVVVDAHGVVTWRRPTDAEILLAAHVADQAEAALFGNRGKVVEQLIDDGAVDGAADEVSERLAHVDTTHELLCAVVHRALEIVREASDKAGEVEALPGSSVD